MTPEFLYALLLFAHISGALGFFSGLALWVAVLTALRQAQRVEEIRTLTAFMLRFNPVIIVSILLLLAAGITMTVTTWGFGIGWIDVALGSLVLIAPISPGFIEPRIRAIAALAATTPDGPIPAALATRIENPMLGSALYLLVPLVLGIVFLMVVKPTLSVSLLDMVIALVVGLVLCLVLLLPRGRTSQRLIDQH